MLFKKWRYGANTDYKSGAVRLGLTDFFVAGNLSSTNCLTLVVQLRDCLFTIYSEYPLATHETVQFASRCAALFFSLDL